jgi:hypothetical protein
MSRADRARPGTAAADGHTANSLRLLLELVHRAGMSVRLFGGAEPNNPGSTYVGPGDH